MTTRITTRLLASLFACAAIAFPALGQGWNVELVASLYSYWDDALGVAVAGDYAYVAGGEPGGEFGAVEAQFIAHFEWSVFIFPGSKS